MFDEKNKYDPTVSADRVSVAHYSAEEVHQNFQALLDSLDFRTELAELSIPWYAFKQKKKTLREFKVLSIALWSLALQRSFPQEAEEFFSSYRQSAPFLNANTPESKMLQNRLNIYIDLLRDKKDADFVPIATYIAEILALTSEDSSKLRLKVSLITRTLYNLIFNKLV